MSRHVPQYQASWGLGRAKLKCTCHWVGEGNDPDAYLKLDEWCPLHGRDPDHARDERIDRDLCK